MTQYFVTLIGCIDERKRPENFPHEVQISQVIEANDNQELAQKVDNLLFVSFVRGQGAGVRRDPTKMQEFGKIDVRDYMFVPIHMISHIVPIIKPISGMGLLGSDQVELEELPSETEGVVQ
jgi:hypothetical protein